MLPVVAFGRGAMRFRLLGELTERRAIPGKPECGLSKLAKEETFE
jgi:hypothetical protein